MNDMSSPTSDGVAIIGMAGRFPGARNLEEFWTNLREGRESVTQFSEEEVRAAGIDPSLYKLPNYVKAGAVLEDVDQFDALFFGYSARDAEITDPQQRLFLECAWECVENAGYNPDTYPGLIGVYAGLDMSTYLYQIYANIDKLGYVDGFQLNVGNDKDHLATQTSYKLNLRGPSLTVQTACSTSLTAVCLAVQSLLGYHCNMALAGGSAICIPQRKGYYYMPGSILSPDGRCRPFDAAAQGTVIGNGVGVVMLKRLADALADGDNVRAVIRGCALNNDGSAKVGYTAPSIDGQAQAIAMAHAMAGIDPEMIQYMEAHGTATVLGDPIEIAALSSVFRARTAKSNFCGIGSLKSNVGHLASAAGVAGLIKTVLSLEHGEMPPSLHFHKPNPAIDFANSPFYVNTELREWKGNGRARCAAVSSFGVGGTNAHVVLEEGPVPQAAEDSRELQLVLLSAKTSTALEKATDNLAAYLQQHPELDLADVAYTTHVGRKPFSCRRALVCRTGDVEASAAALAARDPQRVITAFSESRNQPVLYMFSGQGTQYPNMGRALYEREPTFRDCVDHCCGILNPHLGFDLRTVLYPANDDAEAADRLRDTAVTQPALFVIELALASLWKEWGVLPTAMVGHSIGEYVAACLSGVLPLDSALGLVALRGRLMAKMAPGGMLAVGMSEAEVQPLLGDGVSLAAVNSPSLCVLSGPGAVMDRVAQQLASRNVYGRRLQTSHAFHSTMMEPAVEEFVAAVREVQLGAPQLPYLSNVTGNWITAELATSPTYWGTHLRHTVRFSDCLKKVLASGDWVLLEVGPGDTLCTLARQQSAVRPGVLVVPSLRASHESDRDLAIMLRSLAQVWTAGAQIDWMGFWTHQKRRRQPLPTYPFERQRYWIGIPDRAEMAARAADASTSRKVDDWLYVPSWKATGSSRHANRGDSHAVKRTWIVLREAQGLGQRLHERLSANGLRIVSAVPGTAFARLDDHTYTIRPAERADYDALLQAVPVEGPLTVAHLWNVSDGSLAEGSPDALARAQERAFMSLVYLAQALGKLNIAQPASIGVISTGLQVVLGDEPIDPAKAIALGVCKVIAQEYPKLRVRSVDLTAEQTADEKIIERIIAELTVEPYDAAVAYRRGRRWVQGFERLQPKSPDKEGIRLRDEGVYLITGGLGNIGLTLAEHLAKNHRARLVLVGRSAFPGRESWGEYLDRNPEDETSRKIRTLLACEEAAGQILVCSADSSNRAQMSAVVKEARARFGAVHGVIHGAGNVTAEAFAGVADTTPQIAGAQFAPKVNGALVLHDLFADSELDFCLMFSSLSAVLGGLGLAAYASANAFLDAFAARENQRDRYPWISVNWDAWEFPGGGAPATAGEAILPGEGMQAFRTIMEHGERQVVVSVTDLKSRFDKWINMDTARGSTGPDTARPVEGTQAHARPSLATQYVEPRSETEKKAVEVWERMLGVAPIGIYDKFFELGGHSLLAIQLTSRLREIFRIELPVQRIFEFPTVAQLSECIDKEVAAAQQAAPELDQEHLTELLTRVEQMSPQEIAALLAQEQAAAH
jgi:acyl transferase domain-containing protein